MKLHRIEANLHAMTAGVIGDIAVGREQRQLRVSPRVFVERFDHATPGFALTIVDLAEIKHRPLHHLATGAALVLDDAPIAMLFAVFEASVGA